MAKLTDVKQIQINANDYSEIEALHFKTGSLDTPAQWKAYIDDLINKGTSIVALDSLPAISTVAQQKAAFNSYAGDIILIPDSTKTTPGAKLEYVGITGKVESSTVDNAITAWEQIGTTDADLEQYYKKGVTYTAAALSAGATSTSEVAGYSATVSGTVKYTKADTVTGSTGSTATSNTSAVSGGTVDFTKATFGGTAATITSTGNYTPAGTISKPAVNLGTSAIITYVDGVKATGGTAVALTGVKSTGTETFVKSYPGVTSYLKTGSVTGVSGSTTASKATAGTVITVAKKAGTATTVGNANVGTEVSIPNVTSAGSAASWSASVDDNGKLSFSWTANSPATLGNPIKVKPAVSSNTTIYGVGDTADITPYTFTNVTVPVAAAASNFVTGLTTTAATGMGVLTGLGTASTATAITGVDKNGTATVILNTGLNTATFTNYTSAALASAPTFYGTSATITVSADYTPAGNISGTQPLAAHSHTYVTLPAHTHSVGKTDDVEAAISLKAAIGAHSHTVGNHTHDIKVNAPSA